MDPLLRPSLAARRSHRRGRRRCPDRSEEPRLRRDRRDPAAERALRRGRRRDPVRGLRHQPADLDRAELGLGGGRRQRGAGGEASPASRTSRRSSPAITLASGVLFLLLAVFKMGWIAQFLSRAVVTGFLFGAAIDVVIGELPKLTGTEVTGIEPAPGAVVVARGRSATRTWPPWSSAASRSRSSSGCGSIAPRVPGALVLVVGGLLASWLFDLGAHGVALVGDVPRGLPIVRGPRLRSCCGTTRARSRSRRWRWC